MKKIFLLITISFALISASVNADAQDTKHPEPAYLELDERPTFKGGTPNDFALWVAKHVKYPKPAKEQGLEGTVIVHFVIGTDGRIADAHVDKSVHPLLDEEAVRVVLDSPRWKTGIKDGKPVKVSYTMPVRFGFR